jgi:hypothetical protein
MSAWTLHWLEAEATLAPWRDAILAEIDAARDAMAPHVVLPRLDLLIQRAAGWGIPELGMNGHAHRKTCLALTLDPDSANFSASLANGTLRWLVVHEVNHALRMAGPGYGRTLGQALVSEGLADHFGLQCLGPPAPFWTTMIPPTEWARLLRLAEPELHVVGYDHPAWFFEKTGSGIPRNTGYTMGFALIGAYLAAHPEATAATLTTEPADAILTDAWPRLRALHG